MLFVVVVVDAAVVVAVDVVAVGIHAVVIRCVLHVVRFDVIGADVLLYWSCPCCVRSYHEGNHDDFSSQDYE